MRFLVVLCFCFCSCLVNSSALGQQTNPSRSFAPAPQTPATPQAIPRPAPLTDPLPTAPQQAEPQEAEPLTDPQTAPQPDPGTSYNFDELDSPPSDDLNLDSNQSYDFGDSRDYQPTSTSAAQSSIASNSDFRGASPQMIGDFGGGSTMFRIGGLGFIPYKSGFTRDSGYLSAPIAFAGGSRRIKIAENNQVRPLDRIYGTLNYFHNSSQAVGAAASAGSPVTVVDNESLVQYTVGVEKTFFDEYCSIDVRSVFTSGVDQSVINPGTGDNFGGFRLLTGNVGNLSATLKAFLLRTKQTSISGGLQLSIPTGSGVDIFAEQVLQPVDSQNQVLPGTLEVSDAIRIDNEALHLMPFIGAYRPIEKSMWLQAFAQVDVPANGNEVRTNGEFVGRITEQTLLYTDISLGKWWYRNRCNSPRYGGRGVTGIASLAELHYTGALNDADRMIVGQDTSSALGFVAAGDGNRFRVLNLTLGLQVEIQEQWRINVAGVLPLREGRYKEFAGRRENRFFDSEFALQINRFF